MQVTCVIWEIQLNMQNSWIFQIAQDICNQVFIYIHTHTYIYVWKYISSGGGSWC